MAVQLLINFNEDNLASSCVRSVLINKSEVSQEEYDELKDLPYYVSVRENMLYDHFTGELAFPAFMRVLQGRIGKNVTETLGVNKLVNVYIRWDAQSTVEYL